MNNFFLRYLEKKNYDSSNWIYDKEFIVQDQKLYNFSKELVLDIPFVVKYFKVLTFEYFFIDNKSNFFLVNKQTLEINQIGSLSDKVICVSFHPNEKWCIILTESELLVFDSYIEYVSSINLKIKNLIKVEWTNDERFAILTKSSINIYNLELSLIAENSDYEFKDATWREKYNIYGCATTKGIRFIEPNGLEHGDPLELDCDLAQFLDNDLLATIKYTNNSSIVELFYCKNFYWYKKASRKIQGHYISKNSSFLIFKSGSLLLKLYIFKEKTHFGTNFYVVDGKSLLYTDLAKQIIPPPFSLSKTDLENDIVDISSVENYCAVLTNKDVTVFEINEGYFSKVKNITLQEAYYSVTLFNDFILIKNEESITAIIYLDEKPKFINMALDEIKTDLNDILNLHKITKSVKDKKIVHCYNFNALLCSDGTIVTNSGVIGKVDIKNFFNISFDKKIYFLSGTILKTDSDEKYENVYSYTVSDGNLVIATSEKCLFYHEDTFSSCYVDPGFDLICVTNFNVIGETRHGTLETFKPRIYTIKVIKNHLNKAEYLEAVELCTKSGISTDIFLNYNIDIKKLVDTCKNNHLISIFTCVVAKLKNFKFILENEKIKRYREVFNTESVIKDKKKKEYFDDLIEKDTAIRMENLNHIFGKFDNCEINIKRDSTGSICGRTPNVFIQEFLSCLNLEKHLKVILFVLVKCERIDLAIKVSKERIKEAIEYIKNITTIEGITTGALYSFNEELIEMVYRLCQKDFSDISSFLKTLDTDFMEFKICSYLGNKKDALYYISRTTHLDIELEYIKKYSLYDECMIYEVCKMSKRPFGTYYEICAGVSNPVDAIVLYELANNRSKALEVAVKHLFWRDAVRLYEGKDQHNFYESLVQRLLDEERTSDAAHLIEEYIKDQNRAFKLYLFGRDMKDALRICTDENYLVKESRSYLREMLVSLEEIKRSFYKYVERLGTIEERAEEYLSETSFSYTRNSRKSTASKLRDRPGGRYEKEFVLDRIRVIGLDLVEWKKSAEILIEIFNKFNMEDCIKCYEENFTDFSKNAVKEITEIFDGLKTQVYDPNRPIIERPDLKYLE